MGIAIITGASSGLGEEFARQVQYSFANIDEVWLIARRKERLEKLAASLKIRTRVIQADLTKKSDLRRIKKQLELSNPKINLLVNCAGFGAMGNFMELSLSEQMEMIDLNDKALVSMTYLALPFIQKKGRIIQIASVAAFLPQPGFAIYAASKSFVLSFSRALNEELKKRCISVTAVCPGPVKTEFFDRAKRGSNVMTIKKYFMANADEVVNGSMMASKKRNPIYTHSYVMKAIYLFSRIIPTRFILMIYRIL